MHPRIKKIVMLRQYLVSRRARTPVYARTCQKKKHKKLRLLVLPWDGIKQTCRDADGPGVGP